MLQKYGVEDVELLLGEKHANDAGQLNAAFIHGDSGLGHLKREDIDQAIAHRNTSQIDIDTLVNDIAEGDGSVLICTAPMQDLDRIITAVKQRDIDHIDHKLRVIVMWGGTGSSAGEYWSV